MLQTKQELPDGQRTGDECVAVMSETGHKTISYILSRNSVSVRAHRSSRRTVGGFVCVGVCVDVSETTKR